MRAALVSHAIKLITIVQCQWRFDCMLHADFHLFVHNLKLRGFLDFVRRMGVVIPRYIHHGLIYTGGWILRWATAALESKWQQSSMSTTFDMSTTSISSIPPKGGSKAY